ncbi:MAG: hypothetical protein PHR16_10565 [Methylovulum sp.]|nr:hypothetical protein [Methylovulum sp.]
MFALTEDDLGRQILGCGDGPASFNAELSQRGGHIVSIDPIYIFDVYQIKSRIVETYKEVMAQTRKNKNEFIWETIPSVEDLGRIRMSAMEIFLKDFDAGKQKGRYIAGELPSLLFGRGQFDIALSSHFLFLCSTHLSAEFHLQALIDFRDAIWVFADPFALNLPDMARPPPRNETSRGLIQQSRPHTTQHPITVSPIELLKNWFERVFLFFG